jgi:hypothetical protein
METSTKDRNRAGRWAVPCLASIVVAFAAVACQRSQDWNGVFHRSQGWLYADGGSSAELPDGRRVWLFGDSMFHQEPGLLYNTIAVQNTEPGRAPLADEIRFFARRGDNRVLDVSERSVDGMRPWLEPSHATSAIRKTWLWPTDALAIGDKLVAFYSELGCVQGEFPACRSYLGNMGFYGHVVSVIENPADLPEEWRTRNTPLLDRRGEPPSQHRLHWGSGLLEDAGWLYVFGTSLGPQSGPEDVKLARVAPEDVGDYGLWQFLTPDGWQMIPTGPTPADLQSVARGGSTELSVERVVRGGSSELVMVQVDPFTQEVVVRSSPARDLESARWLGPHAGPGVRRFSLKELDPKSAGGRNWAGRAQRQRSFGGERLLVSYFSSQTASLRFVEIPVGNRASERAQVRNQVVDFPR